MNAPAPTNAGFPWDPGFEGRVLTTCLQVPSFLDTYGLHLKPAYWHQKAHQVLADAVLEFHKQYRLPPSPESLWEAARVQIGTIGGEGLTEPDLQQAWQEITRTHVEDHAYIASMVQTFVRTKAMALAIRETAGLIGQDGGIEEVHRRVAAVADIGTITRIPQDYIGTTLQRLERRSRGEELVRLPTYLPWLDEMTCGGLLRSKVGVVMAPTRTGKSSLLCAIAAASVYHGVRVAYFTHELLDWEVEGRVDCSITGIESQEIAKYPEVVVRRLQEASSVGGGLRVVYAPRNTMTVHQYRSHLNLMRGDGFYPHLIVSDYLDLIQESKSYSDKRDNVIQKSEDLVQLAQEEELPLWTATQTHRDAFHREHVDLDNVGVAWPKVEMTYLVVVLSSTEEMERAGQLRAKIGKHTGAPDGQVRTIFFNRAATTMEA